MVRKKEKLEFGKKTLRNVMVTLLFLSAIKFCAGIISNTSLLLADALHSLIDFFAICTAYIGLSIASLPPSKRFHYGYYKAESLAALFVSFFILFAAFELGSEAFKRLFLASEINYPLLALSISLFSGALSFFLSKYQEKAAKFVNSQAMGASAKEMLLDFFSSLLVFFALVLTYLGIPLEGLGTLIIVLIVGKIAVENLYQTILALMDVAPEEAERKILKVIGNFSGIEGFSNLRLRKAGPFAFGEITIKVRKHLSVAEAAKIGEMLERKIKEKVPEIESISVLVEPFEESKQIIAVPVTEEKGLNSKISEHFARAKGFIIAFVDLKKGKIRFWEYASNPYAKEKVIAGHKTAKWLTQNYRINVVLTKKMGEIAYNTLSQSLVDIYLAKGQDAKQALLNYAKGTSEKFIPESKF